MPITIGAWTSDAYVASAASNARVAFNAAKTVGLALGDGTEVFRSVAQGVWVPTATDSLPFGGGPHGQLALAVAFGVDNECVLVGYDNSNELWVLYSDDGGATWTESASDFSAFNGTSGNVVCGSDDAGVFVFAGRDPTVTAQFIGGQSADGGATWTPWTGPAYVAAAALIQIFYDATSSRWFVAGEVATFSSDLVTWEPLFFHTGPEANRSFVNFARLGTKIFGIGYAFDTDPFTDGVVVVSESSDNGDTWTRLAPTGLPAGALGYTVTLVDDTLVMGLVRAVASVPMFFTSADGTAWSASTDAIPIAPAGVFAIVEGFASTLVAAALDNPFGGTGFRLVSAPFGGPPSPYPTSFVEKTPSRVVADLLFFHTADGGDIEIVSGIETMSDGLEAAAYLSLFGGNSEDSGAESDDAKQWWGNVDEIVPSRLYRSEFQFVLRGLPAISSNLALLEAAAVRDLERTFDGIATTITARATIPAINRVTVAVNIEIDSAMHEFNFRAQWGTSS